MVVGALSQLRDMIMKSLRKEYDSMDVEVIYLWSWLQIPLVMEPRKRKRERNRDEDPSHPFKE